MNMKISEDKIERASSIVADIGQVVFASVVINPIISSSFNFSIIVLGTILSFIAWIISILLSK